MGHDNSGSVTARLKGGLGNQLFQYAAGKALATQLDSAFAIDTAFFYKTNNSNRKFKLPDIGVSAPTNNFSKLLRLTNKLTSQVLPSSINRNINYLSEPADYAYHAFSCNATQDIYLDGYWQSEKYFLDIRDQLLADIDFSQIEAAAQSGKRAVVGQATSLYVRHQQASPAFLRKAWVYNHRAGH